MLTSAPAGSKARQALQRSGIPALRKLDVQETGGTIVLSGSVGSYYLKQLAQETIMSVLDRRLLDNRVKVE